ncbi:cytochrome P450 3A16-like [Watersipora subatra]|uniref:cytochrome P450 3A16-like n=1 Tax=Watersipora subatra TaxID=2589382 RepID=UPI00355B7400
MDVPYEKPWPFIGSIHTLFLKSIPEIDAEFRAKFPGRIAGQFLGRVPILNSSDAEFIRDITIKNLSKFTNRRDFFEHEHSKFIRLQIFALQGDHWKHVRSLLAPSFTSGRLKQMYPTINTCAEKFVEHIGKADSAPIIIKDYSSGYTMDVIASTAFGMDVDAQSTLNHPFVQHAGTFFGIPRKTTFFTKLTKIATLLAVLLLPKFLQKRAQLSSFASESIEYFHNIVKQVLDSELNAVEKGNNFIAICADKLVDLKDEETPPRVNHLGLEWSQRGLTSDEVAANAISFFGAGYETTGTALQFFFYSMALYPEIQEKLYAAITEVAVDGHMSYEDLHKLEYLDWCLHESLRMFPPILRFDRVANEDCEINGKYIPKGLDVTCLVYAIHHDPEYWEEPEVFRPERFAEENKTELQQHAFLPFGAGARNCVAMRLALLEVKVAIVHVLAAFCMERTSDTPNPSDLEFKKLAGVLQLAAPLKISAIPRVEHQ